MIKNVIFDLSEVLLPGLIGVEEKLEKLTGKSSDLIARALGSFPYYEIDNNLDKLLKGELSYEEYRSSFLSSLGLDENQSSVFDRECIRMFDSPYEYTNALLKRVSASYDLFLLSDHCEIWAQYIIERHGFLDVFKGFVWSYEVGATKKGKEPFEAIVNKYQLNPATCLFVDDNETNIVNANEQGFQTIHFVGEESISQIYAILENT